MGNPKSTATEGCGAFVTKTPKKVQATVKSSKRIPADIFAQQVDDVKIYTETVILHPKSWNAYKSAVTLSWKHVDSMHSRGLRCPKSRAVRFCGTASTRRFPSKLVVVLRRGGRLDSFFVANAVGALQRVFG